MNKASGRSSRTVKAAAVIIIVVLVVFAIFAVLTYPRAILSLPVSFTVGFDSQREAFSVPFLDGWVQVTVAINSGSALWSARIESGNQTLWSHAATQGGQTTYESGWIALSSGTYNFTFSTLGIGSLSAQVTINSKGGFW